jgi:TolB-like protein/Tfp pilus assembly protein PilF
MERRLAAILAADVVGYSRLVRTDEEGTLRTLSAYREVIDGLVAEHSGRVFGSAGDSVIAEFASPVEAVRCAAEVQQELAQRNADAPEDRRMVFRIGVNLGDVVVEGDDLLGDGVNIAARLQELADPGGIYVSDDIHRHVDGKVDLTFADLGDQSLKNIDTPVRVHRVESRDAGLGRATAPSERLPLPDKPSIAVLPFTNMSGDSEQEYFTDGITEDIITELSRFRSLFVIARNSSFSFRGHAVDVKELSERLGVRYIVEGSVRRAGNRVRITAQLIDAVADAHLWAERYDRDLDDVFAVQDEVALAIVTAIEPKLGSAERERAHRKPTENLGAWESYQRGMWHVYRFTAADNAEAQSHFQRAIEHDPNFAPSHAGLAYALYLSVMLGFGGQVGSAIADASEAAHRAIVLDAEDAFGQVTVGRVNQMMGEREAAISAYEKALTLNPNFASAHYGLGWALIYDGQPEEGLTAVDEAIRLSPRDPMLWGFLTLKGLAFLSMDRNEEALKWIRMALRQSNPGVRTHVLEVIALAHLDCIEEAKQALQRIYTIKPDFDMNFVRATAKMMCPAIAECFINGLRKAGISD